MAKKTTIETKCLTLSFVWGIRSKLRAEGGKLRAEGGKLRAEGDKLWAEGVIEAFGNITIEWKNYSEEKEDYECHLGNGLVFKP